MPNVPGLVQLPFEKICGERKEVEERAVNRACLGMVALCDEDKNGLSTGRTMLASAQLVEEAGGVPCFCLALVRHTYEPILPRFLELFPASSHHETLLDLR